MGDRVCDGFIEKEEVQYSCQSSREIYTYTFPFSGVFLLRLENDMKCRERSCILMAKIAEHVFDVWGLASDVATCDRIAFSAA